MPATNLYLSHFLANEGVPHLNIVPGRCGTSANRVNETNVLFYHPGAGSFANVRLFFTVRLFHTKMGAG
jgi:hypothetical protein